jgi:hypothetical protein
MDWIYNGDIVSSSLQLQPDCIGFIYLITNHVDNRIYVGRKQLYSIVTKKPTAKELQQRPKAKPTSVKKESDWLQYWGSSKELTDDIKLYGIENKELCITRFTRQILRLCNTKIDLTYWEVHYQCLFNVLTTNSYNKSILGKFFKGRIT